MHDDDHNDFEEDVLNYWVYYELVRDDGELFVVETIITRYEDMVAAQSDSETYYHAVKELDEPKLMLELMKIGATLEEGESADVREIVLAADYEEDLDDEAYPDDLDDEDEDTEDDD